MATAADGELQVLAAGELHRGDDVRDAGSADDQRRPLVDHAVPDRPRLVVAGVGRGDELAPDAFAKLLDGAFAEDRSHVLGLLPVVSLYLAVHRVAGTLTSGTEDGRNRD